MSLRQEFALLARPGRR